MKEREKPGLRRRGTGGTGSITVPIAGIGQRYCPGRGVGAPV